MVEVVEVFQQKLDDHHGIFPWAMNVMAVSSKEAYAFIARNVSIAVIPILRRNSFGPVRQILNGHQDNITSLKGGFLGHEEVIVSVDAQGLVFVHFVDDLTRAPLQFMNNISTWGIAVNGPQRVLAISANDFAVRVFRLGNGSTSSEELLQGHQHNIPSIDISSDGQYIVSASIDQTCRIWNLQQQSVMTRVISDQWGWSVKFIPSSSLRSAPSNLDAFARRQPRNAGILTREQPRTRGERFVDNNLFVVYTTTDLIVLLSFQLDLLAWIPFSYVTESRYREENLMRLALTAFVPEWALLIVASQGMGQIALLQILKSNENGANGQPMYCFAKATNHAWPRVQQHRAPISSIDVVKHYEATSTDLLISIRIYLLYLDGNVLAFDVSFNNTHSTEFDIENVML